MTKKWHKGPPPSVGWWPASTQRDPAILRWWNGSLWSGPVHDSNSAEEAGALGKLRDLYQSDIEWTDRPESWPARSKT